MSNSNSEETAPNMQQSRYPAQLDSTLSPPPGALFPSRLYQLLEDAEKDGLESIISWMPDGKSFKVHDKEKFERDLMPRYFGSSKYRSFQKNLNLWGFLTVLAPMTNPQRGEVSNPNFVRGCPDKCLGMKRVVKSKLKNQQHLLATNNSAAIAAAVATMGHHQDHMDAMETEYAGKKDEPADPPTNLPTASNHEATGVSTNTAAAAAVGGGIAPSLSNEEALRRLSYSSLLARSKSSSGYSALQKNRFPSTTTGTKTTTTNLVGAESALTRHLRTERRSSTAGSEALSGSLGVGARRGVGGLGGSPSFIDEAASRLATNSLPLASAAVKESGMIDKKVLDEMAVKLVTRRSSMYGGMTPTAPTLGASLRRASLLGGLNSTAAIPSPSTSALAAAASSRSLSLPASSLYGDLLAPPSQNALTPSVATSGSSLSAALYGGLLTPAADAAGLSSATDVPGLASSTPRSSLLGGPALAPALPSDSGVSTEVIDRLLLDRMLGRSRQQPGSKELLANSLRAGSSDRPSILAASLPSSLSLSAGATDSNLFSALLGRLDPKILELEREIQSRRSSLLAAALRGNSAAPPATGTGVDTASLATSTLLDRQRLSEFRNLEGGQLLAQQKEDSEMSAPCGASGGDSRAALAAALAVNAEREKQVMSALAMQAGTAKQEAEDHHIQEEKMKDMTAESKNAASSSQTRRLSMPPTPAEEAVATAMLSFLPSNTSSGKTNKKETTSNVDGTGKEAGGQASNGEEPGGEGEDRPSEDLRRIIMGDKTFDASKNTTPEHLSQDQREQMVLDEEQTAEKAKPSDANPASAAVTGNSGAITEEKKESSESLESKLHQIATIERLLLSGNPSSTASALGGLQSASSYLRGGGSELPSSILLAGRSVGLSSLNTHGSIERQQGSLSALQRQEDNDNVAQAIRNLLGN